MPVPFVLPHATIHVTMPPTCARHLSLQQAIFPTFLSPNFFHLRGISVGAFLESKIQNPKLNWVPFTLAQSTAATSMSPSGRHAPQARCSLVRSAVVVALPSPLFASLHHSAVPAGRCCARSWGLPCACALVKLHVACMCALHSRAMALMPKP
jgi:hypothetical protein